MHLSKSSLFTALALAPSLMAGQANADTINVSLSGTTQYDAWLQADNALTAGSNPGYPGFPGSAAWPAPIGSSAAGSGDAGLNKVSNGTGGGPYPASASIYYGGFSGDINNNGGTLSVADTTPVAGLANIVFQLEIGEAWTYDLFDGVLPVLSYTTGSGTYTIAGESAAQFGVIEKQFSGTVTMPTGEEDVFVNTYLVQWDLSGLGETVLGFEVHWTAVQHAQLYELRLDQSDTFETLGVSFVPEPASLVLLAMGVCMLTGRRRTY